MTDLQLEAKDLNQQGALLLKAGNFDAAKVKFDRAIEIDPMLMDSYMNYGDLYMAQENYREAKNHYKKALLIEKSGELYFRYGNACFMGDDPHEGLENYNLAISAGYDNDEMLFFMGMAYEHLNDDTMALRYFQKASIKNPSRPDYIVKKVAAQIRLDMIDSAEDSVDELLKSAPELFDGYHLKSQLLILKKMYKEACDFAKAASDRFPEDAELMFDYAKSLSLLGDFEAALKVLDTAKKMKYFDNAKRNFTMLEAQITAEQGNTEKAIECCNKCIALESEGTFDGEARFMLLNLHLINKEYETVLNLSSELIANDAEDSYYYAALYYKPFCLKELGKKEESAALYKEANAIYRLATIKNPAAVDIYLYRAMCLKDCGDYDQALDMLEFISNISDNIAEVHTIRADIYRSLGKEAQAKAEMQKAFEIKPMLKDAYEEDGE
jgi:tetratricopeptide (TPR) repeat protein